MRWLPGNQVDDYMARSHNWHRDADTGSHNLQYLGLGDVDGWSAHEIGHRSEFKTTSVLAVHILEVLP